MKEGLVSTIIPVYNREMMLLEAVNSVVNQDYRPIEIIIVDDGSTDNTLEVARSLARANECVTVLNIDNSGPGVARENGRQQARGEFIQYLDSDDLLSKDKFSLQVRALKAAPDAAACYCKTSILVGQDLHEIEAWKRTGEKIETLLPSMLSGRWWGTSTPLYRRSVCDAAGPWLALINEEDWEYDCRIALSNNKLCRVDKTLSYERHHTAPRLSEDGSTDAIKLAARSKARLTIIEYAVSRRVVHKTPEFEHLLVACSFLSRQCAAAGLIEQSKLLLRAAKMHLSIKSKHYWKIVIYQWLSRLIGWRTVGRFSAFVDSLRP